MSDITGLKTVPRLSLRGNKGIVIDETDGLLLGEISETNSLTQAAKLVGISYRNAWDRVRRIQKVYGKPIMETQTGGATGGSSRLTPEGTALLKEYRSTNRYLSEVVDDKESAANVGYKLSARNRFRARIEGIEKGGIATLVKMTTEAPVSLTSMISEEAVGDLDLHEGDEVVAIVKSTEVMIAKGPMSAKERKAKTKSSH